LRELSLHIMDIAENGLAAGASLIDISVVEDEKRNRLRIQIKDNGRGIPVDLLEKVLDPFYTTRTTRRVGLGLSLFREAARRCDGEFHIDSKEGEGTGVLATFRLDHIDLAPLGDMAGSLISLIMGNPDASFVYTHEVAGKTFRMDTREVEEDLDGVPITNPEVIRYLAGFIRGSLADLRTMGNVSLPLQEK
jgi:anti-sigma regulatory factor (Ser/Thr protein kinase)